MYEKKNFFKDQKKDFTRKMRFKFFIVSLTQKIVIALLCFSLNSSPKLVHGLYIGIKSLMLILYFRFKPYINWGFDFFKLIQEFHFLLISIFLIQIQKVGSDLETAIIIEDS
jgi:hypothetical protein